MRTLSLLLTLTFATSLPAQAPVGSTRGVVVCVSPLAAEVGAAVLARGGNAVDAGVATAFALAVTWPEAGNVGGGGFMLVQPPGDAVPTFIDYREKAPLAATKEMFAGKIDYTSAVTAGVPGTVRGLELAHKKHGKLPWKDLVMPAVALAENGFPVNAALASSLNAVLKSRQTTNAEFRRVYGKNGGKEPWLPGDTLKLLDLGRTLRKIAEQGPAAFYSGDLADAFDAEMTASAGLITKQDLAAYAAVDRPVVVGTYRGYDIVAAAPPSSGGTTLIETLNVLENFDVKVHPRHSAETIHLMTEAMRRSFRDRAAYLGDPDFTKVPAHITSKEHAKKLAATIDLTKATKSESLAGDIPLAAEGTQTTHFSIVDGAGTAVSNTFTLENSYGCRVVVRGAGFILNNEMTDFNHKPGVTDRTGNIGTPANQVAGGKRMLSSMCPVIVRKGGKTVLVTGSPGGRTILNTVACVVVNFVDYGMDARAAVDEPRHHMQWFPDRISLEDSPDFPALSAKLKALGHAVTKHRQGDAHTVVIDPTTGTAFGAADKRLDGAAVAPK
jgi:gamma-glutamyltranspeptidase/glutathione hydrolase